MEEINIKTTQEKEEEMLDDEVNVLDFELDEEQINDLIDTLGKLREHKQNVRFEIDDDYELSIHHADSEYEEMPAYEEDSE